MIKATARFSPEEIKTILDRHPAAKEGMISALEAVQDKLGYLPEEALRAVAERTGRPLTEVYGVATFYRFFRLEPRGRHLISACLGTACHVRGGPAVAAEIGRQLAVKPGETTANGEFTFETVNCLGACALGPIVVVDGHYFSNVQPAQVAEVLTRARAGLDRVEPGGDERVFQVEVNCPRCNHSLMEPKVTVDGLPSIRMTVAFNSHHGSIYLSSLYGSSNIQSQVEIPMGTVLNFFCPHCYAEMTGASSCPACGSPTIPMVVRGGGMIRVCSRRGCYEHRLDLNGVNA